MNKVRVFLAVVLVLPTALLFACGGESLPALTSSSAFVDFGEIQVGETGESTLRVVNAGIADAEIALPSISGDEATAFGVVDAEWPLNLAAGATAEITLSFTPSGSGVWTADIVLFGVLPGALSGGVGSSTAQH